MPETCDVGACGMHGGMGGEETARPTLQARFNDDDVVEAVAGRKGGINSAEPHSGRCRFGFERDPGPNNAKLVMNIAGRMPHK